MKLNSKNRRTLRIVIALIGMALAYFANEQYKQPHSDNGSAGHTQNQANAPKASTHSAHRDDSVRLVQAHAKKQSKVWMTIQATVKKTLPDDTKGHQHQKFLIKPKQGPVLLVAHNIDLAPRVPIRVGDVVWLRGRYEWNAKGGVLHWTHHDPKKPNRQDPKEGWIELNGKVYE